MKNEITQKPTIKLYDIISDSERAQKTGLENILPQFFTPKS